MLWEAVLVGRENDPSFLLKALVNDIEKRYEGKRTKQPRPNPYIDNDGKPIDKVKAKAWENIPRSFALEGPNKKMSIEDAYITVLAEAAKTQMGTGSKGQPKSDSDEVYRLFYQEQRKRIQDYYKKLISNQKNKKYTLSELNKEWIEENRYWNPKDSSIDESKKKIFTDLGIPIEINWKTGYDRPASGFEDKFFGSNEGLELKLKELNQQLEKEEKKTDEDLDNISFDWQTKEEAIKGNKKFIEYLKDEIQVIEGRIQEGKKNQLSNKELFSMYGGKAKFQKKINDSYISAIKLLEQEDLKLFDENYKKMQTKIDKDISYAIKNIKPSPDMKDNITFGEVYSNIEGSSELSELKELLKDDEMKQYLELLSDKYSLPKKWDEMSDKEQNAWELDNKRKFQSNYQRLLKTLYALKNKYSADASTSNKVSKVEAVIKTLNDRFSMKSWEDGRKEAEEMKRESGTSLRRDSKDSDFGPNKLKRPKPKKWKTMSFKEQQEWYSKNTIKNPSRKAAEESDMQNIYEVIFNDKEPLDKLVKNKKIKALLPSKEVDVTKPTREMWSNLLTKLEAFSKSKNPESQFNKLILSNELYLIDVINLMQTRRNNVYPKYTKLTGKKLVMQKPPKKKKEVSIGGKKTSQLSVGNRPPKPKKAIEDDPNPEYFDTSETVPKDPRTASERAWDEKHFRRVKKAEDDEKPLPKIGSNKAAMEAREKKYAKMYREAITANYAKLKADMNKVNSDDLDKYFSKTKSVMDSDLFHWIDKTNKGITMRVIPYGEGDKDYSTIRKDVLDIMKILDKDMEYDGSEMKVLDVLNVLGRKVYKKKAGSIVSDKRRDVSAKLKTIGEETVRAVMAKDSNDFKIPRLFKLKLKQNNLKLKKEFYNIFTATPTPNKTTKVETMRMVEGTEEKINELTEIEKIILSRWKLVSDAVVELSKPEIKAREESFKRKQYAQALRYILDFEEAIESARKPMDIMEQEVIVLSERLQKDPVKFLLPSGESSTIEANKERIESEVQRVLRLLKRKQSYIDRVQKEIDKWQSLADKIEKDLEE